MPRKPRLNYRQVRKVLRQFGIMENPRRGKGSHRVFSHPNFRGSPRFYGIRKAFDLTEEEFYYT